MGLIKSVIDTDAYKISMQQAVLELYPDAQVTYEFTSRRSTPVNRNFFNRFKKEIECMADLKLNSDEASWLKSQPIYKPAYVEYLKNYRFNPDELKITAPDKEIFDLQELKIVPTGSWHSTILWEVPILALISDLYFETVDTDWNYDGQTELIRGKSEALSNNGCVFTDFGTRRRRSFRSQENVVRNIIDYPTCAGTSNMFLAMANNVKAIGTVAHEWTMGISGLESLAHANRYALHNWYKVYQGNLGIALTDTFGTTAFFEDFDKQLARMYDGVRHDSGDPFTFALKVVKHYEKLGIRTNTKTIIFSDGLDVETAIKLKQFCDSIGINCTFGIGTNFTNDFGNSKALNIVMKLRTIAPYFGANPIQLVKLSDVITKATGDADALRIAKYVFFGQAL